jgi:hypothetical protein
VGEGVAAASPAAPDRVGLVTFGSGFTVAAQVVEDAAFLLAMTPRIPADLSYDLSGVPTRVSVASEDSRGTAAQAVLDWFGAHAGVPGEVTAPAAGSGLEYAEYLSEHIIGVPEVWRRRVSDDAAWLAGR